jgi:hypothetical protein
MKKLLDTYALMMTPEILSLQCQERKFEACQDKRCFDRGFSGCRAQKSYYFTSVIGKFLIATFEFLEKAVAAKSDVSSEYHMEQSYLKELLLSIAIQAYTVHWNSKGRN